MNEVEMNNEPFEKIFQTLKQKLVEFHKLKMEKKLKKSAQLHEQENIWWPHNQNSLCWSLYYINDGAKVDNKV